MFIAIPMEMYEKTIRSRLQGKFSKDQRTTRECRLLLAFDIYSGESSRSAYFRFISCVISFDTFRLMHSMRMRWKGTTNSCVLIREKKKPALEGIICKEIR